MAASIFARIGTIKGESRDAQHKDEIEVLSWSWGVSGSGAVPHGGAGSGVGRARLRDLTLTHHVDAATPQLMKACATGQHLPDATIAVRRAGRGQHDYLVLTLTDVLVTEVAMSVTAEEDATSEVVVLSFATVDLEYRPQRPDGSVAPGISVAVGATTNRTG